jgi:lipoate-protein ligase A
MLAGPLVEFLQDATERDPALDIALAQARLDAVAQGRRRGAIRIYRPRPAVAFGRRDALLPGYTKAVAAARAHGFTPVLRAQGGRAAAYDRGCLIVDEAMPAEESTADVQGRFAREAARQADALRRLGVDARVGEVPGEYCPGAFTVNSRAVVKLVGSAQRVVRGGWLFSSVVVVEGTERLRAVLEAVYSALDFRLDPATVGAISGELPGASIDDVSRALLDTYGARYRLLPAAISAEELAAAAARLGRHQVDD